MDTIGVPAWDIQVAGLFGTAAEDDRVIAVQNLFRRDRPAHIHIGAELNALRLHDLQAALDDVLFQFHIGDAVHQQAANAVSPLKHGHGVASDVQVLGHREAGGAAADDRHALARAGRGRGDFHPALGVSRFHNGVLVFPDGNAAAGHIAAGAGRLAQGGADPAGELRETVGGFQAVERHLPLALINQVVPLRDQVVQRAAGGHAADHHARLAEGDAAVHAACRLGLLLLAGEPDVKFVKVFHALQRRYVRAGLARIIHKSCGLAHDVPLLTCSSAPCRMLRSAPARRPDRALPPRRSPAACGRSRKAELS